ncbi:MAG TPA: ABC transporter substrate-binding protein [Candidatus Binatia bacterium]|jgi:putative ABC transport system substrate-binding protein
MERKIVTVALCALLFAVCMPAEAQQQKKVWQLGVFHVGLDHVPGSFQRLKEGLKARGYEEGKNIQLDWRNLPDDEAARKTAEEFVRSKVDIIVAFENQTIRAAKAATSEIPVVFLHATDPVVDGYVQSLARPGGNMTGFVGLRELPDKQMELFKEIVPRLHRLLVLVDYDDPTTERLLTEVKKVSSFLKVQVIEQRVSDAPDIERIFGSIKRGNVDGVFIVSPNLQQKFTALTLRLATEKQLPMAVHVKGWVEKGGLFSYGHDPFSVGTEAAVYVDKILKGIKPADLPVQQPTKFELVINLKTANQIGLTIPPNVLARADRVIR